VVLYAFIILKAVLPILLPLIASRKRALDGPKGINWSDYRNVTNRFGTVPGWWEDIALALSYHPVTCKYTHLHSSAGLNSWFAKYRKLRKFGNIWRDARCRDRWLDYLTDEQKRSVLLVHFQRAVVQGSEGPSLGAELQATTESSCTSTNALLLQDLRRSGSPRRRSTMPPSTDRLALRRFLCCSWPLYISQVQRTGPLWLTDLRKVVAQPSRL